MLLLICFCFCHCCHFFIGPRSDHSLLMSVTHWLTDWLTDWLTNLLKPDVTTLLKIEWIDPFWQILNPTLMFMSGMMQKMQKMQNMQNIMQNVQTNQSSQTTRSKHVFWCWGKVPCLPGSVVPLTMFFDIRFLCNNSQSVANVVIFSIYRREVVMIHWSMNDKGCWLLIIRV